MSNKEKATKISWLTLAFMAFSTVWGFGNITNGFVYFNGPQVIFSWIFMFVLYFIPYALMVGELGSAFKNEGGGVSSWLHQTTNAKLAYYAGWTYWACHITYIASKGSGFLKALSWAIFRNAETYDSFPTRYIQLATFCILLLGCYIASLGLNPLKKLLTAAGTCTFVMSLLYIVMMFAAPAINPTAEYVHANLSFSSLIPNFNVTYFTSLSILVFAVGGCEKISPYVNKVENPSKGFPRGMITLAVMVVTCAILGTLAMSRMFDPAIINASAESFNAYVANSSYWAFQKLGQYYHVGDLFMIIYALCNVISQLAVLILSIDAPLRMLLDNEHTQQFIPQALHKVQRPRCAQQRHQDGGGAVRLHHSGTVLCARCCCRSAPADQAELCVHAHALPVGVCRLHRPAQRLRYHPRRVPLCQESGRGQVLRRLVLCRYRRVLRAGYV